MVDAHDSDDGDRSDKDRDPSPFNLDRLRLDNRLDLVGLSKPLLDVRVGRPGPQDFIRVHPEPAYRLPLALIELAAEREFYLLDRRVLDALADEWFPVILYTTVDRAGVVRLWPAKSPKFGRSPIPWHTTAHRAAERAVKAWVRVVARRSCYVVIEATTPIPDPIWPAKPFDELIEMAFQGRIIESLDHPAVKQLRGRV